MHEELLKHLLAKYKAKDESFARVVSDPVFKSLPLEERVELLKENGHLIREGTKLDSRIIKDLGWGALGTALVLHEPLVNFGKNFVGAYNYGAALKDHKDNGSTTPPPVFDFKGASELITKATGAGLIAKQLTKAIQDNNTRRLVKRLLSENPEENTQDKAIQLIARS